MCQFPVYILVMRLSKETPFMSEWYQIEVDLGVFAILAHVVGNTLHSTEGGN